MGKILYFNNELLFRYIKIITLVFFWIIGVWLAGGKNLNTWIDINTYLSYFHQAKYIISFKDYFVKYYDPLFLFFIKPFTSLNCGFNYFLYAISAVTLFIKCIVFYKKTDNIFIFLLLYMSFLFFLHDYVQIRISLALALFLYSIYITELGLYKIFIWVLAFLIHASIILPIGMYFMAKRLSRINFILFSISIILFSNLFISFFYFIPKIELYIKLMSQKNYQETNLLSSMVLIQLITLSYLYFKYNRLKIYEHGLEYRLAWLGVVLFYTFYQVPVFAHRFYELFIIFFIILLSNIYKKDLITLILPSILIISGIKTIFFGVEVLTPF